MSRRARSVSALVLLALFGASAWISPAPAEVAATGALRAKYLRNTDRNAAVFDGRLELDVSIGVLNVGTVYRAYQLTDPGYDPAGEPVGIKIPRSEIKHRYAELAQGDLYARAGHFVSTFGRGLTLRSYEDVDLEHDTLLDGFLAEYAAGGVTFTVLSGDVSESRVGEDDYDHTVRGVRASVPVGEWLTVSGSSVDRVATEVTDTPGQPPRFEDGVLGGELEAWMGPATMALEYAGRTGDDPTIGMDEVRGHAFYASGTLELGRLTLFGEVKDYEEFAHYLVSPPTCVREHMWTLMNRATYEPVLDDEHGFLVEGSMLLGDGLFLVGGASEARKHNRDLSHWEIFGEAEQTIGTTFVRIGGSWSREYEDALYTKYTEHMIGAADIDLELGSGDVAELGFEAQRVEEPSGLTYEDYIGSVTFYPGADFTLSTVVEATTYEFGDDVWAAVEVKRLFSDDLEIGVSVGSERGGKKCSGGVCYYEPQFEGARLRLTKYF